MSMFNEGNLINESDAMAGTMAIVKQHLDRLTKAAYEAVDSDHPDHALIAGTAISMKSDLLKLHTMLESIEQMNKLAR